VLTQRAIVLQINQEEGECQHHAQLGRDRSNKHQARQNQPRTIEELKRPSKQKHRYQVVEPEYVTADDHNRR